MLKAWVDDSRRCSMTFLYSPIEDGGMYRCAGHAVAHFPFGVVGLGSGSAIAS